MRRGSGGLPFGSGVLPGLSFPYRLPDAMQASGFFRFPVVLFALLQCCVCVWSSLIFCSHFRFCFMSLSLSSLFLLVVSIFFGLLNLSFP